MSQEVFSEETIPLSSCISPFQPCEEPLKEEDSDLLRNLSQSSGDLPHASSPFHALCQRFLHLSVVELQIAVISIGITSTCYLLYFFQTVLIPFFLAMFLTYLTDPLVECIDVSPRYFLCIFTSSGRRARRQSRGCSRPLASLCAVSMVCMSFVVLGYMTARNIRALDILEYQNGYAKLMVSVEKFSAKMGVPLNITTTLHDNINRLVQVAFTQTMDLISVIFVTLIYLTYFLSTRTRLCDAGGVYSRVDHDIQRFVTLKCFLSLLIAVFVTIVYAYLNVGLAIVWGICTFLLNWIPNVGAIIASLLPLTIIIITPSSVMTPMDKLFAVLSPMSIHILVGNFVEPKMFGKKLELDPVVVILSLSVWGLLWGVVGMMLSVPLTAALKIMLSHLQIWPELVAFLDGTYFIKYGINSQHKKNDKEHEYDSSDMDAANEQILSC